MMGRPGSGRARKASISFPRSATMIRPWLRHSGTRLHANPQSRSHDNSWIRVYASRADLELKTLGLAAGVEERRQPGLDPLGDFLSGTILGVTEGARTGKALIAAGDIEGHARERRAGHDR